MRWLYLALISLVLGGCQAGPDHDQARLCRVALAGIVDPGTPISIVAQTAVPGRIGGAIVRVDYRADDGRHGFVECRFGTSDQRLTLLGVRTVGGQMSAPRVFMLNRFWLPTDEGLKSDPMPVEGADRAVPLPAGSGYAVQQFINAIPGAAVYGLLAAAYSLVYGLVGRINLAFGAFAAIGGAATVLTVLACGAAPLGIVLPLALVAAAASTGLHGLVVSRLVFKPLAGSTGQQGLVATIGLALVLGEYLRLALGSQPVWIVPILHTPVALARDPAFLVTITPIAVVVAAAAGVTAAGLLWSMKHTSFGRNWRAYSDDPGAAQLFGVGRDAILGRTMVVSAGLAGLAGCLTSLFFGDVGIGYATTLGLKALAAAVLGGIGSVPGGFLGGVFIGLVEAGWSAAFPIVSRDLVVYCILIATLVWRPGGFLGYRDLTPRRV